MVKFSSEDVVDIGDWIPEGEYNPHNIHPWLLHDHGFVVAVVFASNLQDALDIAVDNDKMERYLVADEDMDDYEDDEGSLTSLGNAGELHNIESLQYVEMPNCKLDFATLWYSQHG